MMGRYPDLVVNDLPTDGTVFEVDAGLDLKVIKTPGHA